MKDLLKQWHKLEPEYTQWVEARSLAQYEEPAHWEVFVDGCAYPFDEMTLQYAVQQAIEARFWNWTTDFIAREQLYEAFVNGKTGCSNTSPAEALLSAYLQALEAEVPA